MPVILNLGRCDNVKECGVPGVCKHGAIFWDEGNNTLATNAEKCIDCGLCEKECPSGAVVVIRDKDEFNAALQMIKDNQSAVKALFVDRYGAMCVEETNEIDFERAKEIIAQSDSAPILIELLNADSPSCLISAVPYSVLLGDRSVRLYKVMRSGQEFGAIQKYFDFDTDVALIVCKNGKAVDIFKGKVEDGSNAVKDLMRFINQNI